MVRTFLTHGVVNTHAYQCSIESSHSFVCYNYALCITLKQCIIRCVMNSDVKFHDFFWREIFRDIFREIFLKYLKNFTMDYGCRLYSSLQQSK